MRPDTSHRWREEVGAYVLGLLPEDEAAELEAHLATCDECRQEVRELSPVAAVLPAADPDWVGVSASPPEHLRDRVFHATSGPSISVLRRPDRFRQVLVGLTAAAVALAVVVVVFSRESPEPAHLEAVRFRLVPPGVVANAQLHPMGAKLEVHFRAQHLPPGAYRMSISGKDGRSVSSQEFHTTATGSWSGARTLEIARADAAILIVHEVGGEAQLIADLPPPPS